jgi:hypothetical protein
MELTRTSPYTILRLDESDNVTAGKVMALKDPTGYMQGEARFEASTEPRQNPLRLKAGWRVTTEQEVIDPDTGLPVTVNVPVEWKYCKQIEDYEIVEMTQAEKDAVDAAAQAAEDAAKDAAAEADSKIIYLKALVLCINDRIPQNPITLAEFKQKIRSLM